MNEVSGEVVVDKRVVSFFHSSTNLTLATCVNNIPYCANCFYAYDESKNYLVFKSDPETNHIRQAIKNNQVAGTILPDKLEKAKIKGIQFNGNFIDWKKEDMESLKNVYYKKYPFARAFSGEMWGIELTYIKMTDNTLGFGKKIEWKK
ncbi:MAG TPA: pyridoxamine 5'-phosphate oxidase family protein [Bacteroidia bacterium]